MNASAVPPSDSAHLVVIGYGTTGSCAARTVAARIFPGYVMPVVVDHDVGRVAIALLDGLWSVLGDGGDPAVLRRAAVADAGRIVIAVPKREDVVRITSAARSLNRSAAIVVLVHEPDWRDSVARAGADHIVVAGQEVGRRLGSLVRRRSECTGERAAMPAVEWVVLRRPVWPAEVGRAPAACGPEVLAVVRDGVRHWREDPDVESLRGHDLLLVVSTGSRKWSGMPW